MAIQLIKRGKKFRDRIVKSRVYGQPEKDFLDDIMKQLETEYNNLSDKQPVIMDVMLETMENLKSMRKNYGEDMETYNFDHREFLDTTVKGREKVYLLKEVNHDNGESTEEEFSDDN